MEEWRPIEGFEYEVSNLGRVRSWRPKNGIGGFVDEPRFISLETNKHGYKRVGMRVLGERKKRHRMVHQLVLEAFVGPKPDGYVCCHGDGNRTNNVLSNLRWDTPKANALDSMRHGTTATGDRNGSRVHPERLVRGDRHHARLRPETRPRGERHANATITSEIAAAVFTATGTYAEIAERFGTTKHVVENVKHGKSWKHVTGGLRVAS